MKRHFILGIMALAALASCSKSEVLTQESMEEKGITFSAYVGKPAQTKATTIDPTNAGAAGIGLLAWRTGNQTVNESILSSNAPAFMSNLKLTIGAEKTEDSGIYSATYTPVRYWPSTGSLVSFYAYAPYTDGNVPDPTDANYAYHPENLTINTADQGSGLYIAHKISLEVPMGDANKSVVVNENGTTQNINDGKVYANQTDFMVARVGTNAEGYPVSDPDGSIGTTSGSTFTPGVIGGTTVGVNQNLNKAYDGAVELKMKHALSKIRFEARAGDPSVETGANAGQNKPYTDVRVVFDHISVNGTFVKGGTYNLHTEKWESVTSLEGNDPQSYSFLNEETNDDAFNPIADSLWNYIVAPYTDAPAETFTATNGWYKLNKSSHDLMIIPVSDASQTPAQISSITGCYKVQTYTYQQKEDENGLVYEDDGNGNQIPVMEKKLEDKYTDPVYFKSDVNINLEAGKEYIFRFDIKLKEIIFEVAIEGWDNSIDDSSNHIYNISY